jgi:hypothetical protein
MNEIAEQFYQWAIEQLPKCTMCNKWQRRACTFWYWQETVLYGLPSSTAVYAHFNLCDTCMPERLPNYRDWVVFPEKRNAKLRALVEEYEKQVVCSQCGKRHQGA